MSNVLGKNVTLTLFGESHGPLVGATLDGLPSGIEVKDASIAKALSRRRPQWKGETPRVENDSYSIVSGLYQGKTTGEPLTILIENANVHSKDYDELASKFRPNHADFVAHQKYQGFEDYRGGGHFSGRITAALVAAGAIAKDYLAKQGIEVGAHIAQLGSALDSSFDPLHPEKQIASLSEKSFPVINEAIETTMKKEMETAAEEGDSLGGAVELAISGLPVGLGSPWFNRLDGALASAMFSIGGVRGVSFGDIADNVGCKGSFFNDPFYAFENGKIETKSNHSGGIQGGLSNGMPVLLKVLIKPTPSISLPQQTVNRDGENVELALTGRHDPCIVRRIVPVLEAMVALTLCDFYVSEFGRR